MDHKPSNFHQGEKTMQEIAGELDQAFHNGSVIANAIMPGAVKFIARQRMVYVGSVDKDGWPWATFVIGEEQFAHADTDRRGITLDLRKVILNPSDTLWQNLHHDKRLGLLFLELATRRRLRVNATVNNHSDKTLHAVVEESYPNCPKFIQKRHLGNIVAKNATHQYVSTSTSLTATMGEIISTADTFFVASVLPDGHVDMSHRGGKPGFVIREDDTSLLIPDYPGNSMFNTLGNFVTNPRAGLLFYDFASNQAVQIRGSVTILHDQANKADLTGGTKRWWRVQIEETCLWDVPATMHWEFLDSSPFNP